MNLNMSFKHMDPSDAIKEYTKEKSEKLTKYFQGRISVTWNFSVERGNRIAHCHLSGNNMNYFGESETQDLRASIDMALDRIETQLRKHKEIVKDHHKHREEPNAAAADDEAAE